MEEKAQKRDVNFKIYIFATLVSFTLTQYRNHVYLLDLYCMVNVKIKSLN